MGLYPNYVEPSSVPAKTKEVSRPFVAELQLQDRHATFAGFVVFFLFDRLSGPEDLDGELNSGAFGFSTQALLLLTLTNLVDDEGRKHAEPRFRSGD